MLSFLELVELPDGDIVLKPSDDENAEPLVTIRFSGESKGYMGGACLDIARAMVQAGIDATETLMEANSEAAESGDFESELALVDDSFTEESETKTLH